MENGEVDESYNNVLFYTAMMSRWIKEHCIVLSIKRGYDMVPGIQ
jgi:hypothetical protein